MVVLRANGANVGLFGMTLDEAKSYFLVRAKKYGLEPIRVKETADSVIVSFYHPSMEKPAGWKMPWKSLRSLARDFGAFDESEDDPPWDYSLSEKPLPIPPEGKYITMEGDEL
jgi:hypothetical protein